MTRKLNNFGDLRNAVMGCLGTLLTLIVCLPLYAHSESEKPIEVKIGAILHLTGEFAIQGDAFRQGIELAIDRLNRESEKKSITFRAVFEDTQYRPVSSLSAAKKLSSDKQIIGVLVSTMIEAKAAATTLERAKLPTIVLWDSSPELDSMGRYVFGIGPWAPSSGIKAAEHAYSKLNARTAAVINTNTEWSVYVSDWFIKEFSRLGGEVNAHFSLDPAETDFRTVILKAKKQNPGAIYAPIDSNILPFFRQMKELKVESPLLTSDILDAELFDEGGPLLEGVFQTMSAEPGLPATKEMIEAYRNKFSHEPEYVMLTAWGYDGAMLIGQAALESGINDREKITDALYTVNKHAGASGEISINGQGSSPREVSVFVVKNQELVATD